MNFLEMIFIQISNLKINISNVQMLFYSIIILQSFFNIHSLLY